MGKSEGTEQKNGWSPPEVDQMVVFYMAGQRYALPIERVQEIQQLVAVSELPDVSPALLGLMNLRGLVVPVIDLRLLVGLESPGYGLQTPMIICRAGSTLAALVIDEVEDVVNVTPDMMAPPSKLYALADKMMAVCRSENDFVFLLDLDKVVPASALAEAAGTEEEAS